MLTNPDIRLFESLARGHPQLRTWLEHELSKVTKTLISAADDAQLRRAQGHAQCLQSLIGHLDSALQVARAQRGSPT